MFEALKHANRVTARAIFPAIHNEARASITRLHGMAENFRASLPEAQDMPAECEHRSSVERYERDLAAALRVLADAAIEYANRLSPE